MSKVRQARLKELHDSKQVSAGNSRSRASLNQRITDHIMTFCELDGGVDQFFKDLKENSNRRVALAIHAYCLRHKGLKELLYVSCNWMLKNKIFVDDDGHVKICLIFIMFGLDSFSDLRTVESSFLEEVIFEDNVASVCLFRHLGITAVRPPQSTCLSNLEASESVSLNSWNSYHLSGLRSFDTSTFHSLNTTR